MSERPAGQNSKYRSILPREVGEDGHARDHSYLPPMLPVREHQSGHQLLGISTLQLPSHTTPENLLQGQQQGARSSGPSRGQSKRNREEAPEQPYQPAYKSRRPATPCPSRSAAPPKHKCAGYEVPCGPAGITPNRHREKSRGRSERNRHEALQQEAQEQRDRLSYENVQATKRHRSQRATPPTYESAGYGVRFGPTSIIPNSHKDMSRGQLERSSQKVLQQEVQELQDRPPYENIQATERHRSGHAAPPRHKTTGHYVPCDPAGITPDRHREMSRGQSERYGHEVLQQEAQEQQYQPFHQIREAARRYPNGPATSQNHGSAGSGVLIPPPDTNIHKDMSEADKKTCLEMRRKHPRVPYKKMKDTLDSESGSKPSWRSCKERETWEQGMIQQ